MVSMVDSFKSLETQDLYKSIAPLIEKEEHDEVKSLLSNFYSHLIDQPEKRLLHCSAHCSHDIIIKYLLERGWEVDDKDTEGQTPLMLAIKSNQDKTVEVLLAAGADIDILNNEGQNALHIANEDGISDSCFVRDKILQLLFREFRKKCSSSEETAEKLIDAGYQLHQAVYIKDAEVIEYMLKRSCPIDSVHPETKQTALHVAVTLDDSESMRVLLKYEADTNILDETGKTPLFQLCQYYPCNIFTHLEVFEALLNRFSPKSCTISNGLCQIGLLLVYANKDVVRLVLHSPLANTVKDETNGTTLLHYLARNRRSGVIEVIKLHIKKYELNARDRCGKSPLCWAVDVKNVDMVEFLLKQGANPDYEGCDPEASAIYIAHNYFGIDFARRRCAELLLQHNANPQVTFISKTGKTLTIFDAAVKSNDCERMMSAIAHLAVLARLGMEITQIIRSKIDSCLLFEKYFNNCRLLLTKSFFGSITVFKLLTQDTNKLAAYLNNEELVIKLTRMRYNLNVRSKYAYYYNTLEKRLKKARRYKELKDRAAQVISEIFEDRIDVNDVVALKIINHLDAQDLQQLFSSL